MCEQLAPSVEGGKQSIYARAPPPLYAHPTFHLHHTRPKSPSFALCTARTCSGPGHLFTRPSEKSRRLDAINLFTCKLFGVNLLKIIVIVSLGISLVQTWSLWLIRTETTKRERHDSSEPPPFASQNPIPSLQNLIKERHRRTKKIVSVHELRERQKSLLFSS